MIQIEARVLSRVRRRTEMPPTVCKHGVRVTAHLGNDELQRSPNLLEIEVSGVCGTLDDKNVAPLKPPHNTFWQQGKSFE